MITQKHTRHVVAEICQPDHPICPWARKAPLHDARQATGQATGLVYVGFDAASLIPAGAHSGPSYQAGRKNAAGLPFLSLQKDNPLPLRNAGLSEFYFSIVTSNSHIPPSSSLWLVTEAARIVRPGGRLIFYNGYGVTHKALFVDFKGNPPFVFFSDHYEALNRAGGILYRFFTPLSLEGHNLFLQARKLDIKYALEPGRDISVLVRKQT